MGRVPPALGSTQRTSAVMQSEFCACTPCPQPVFTPSLKDERSALRKDYKGFAQGRGCFDVSCSKTQRLPVPQLHVVCAARPRVI